jgi:hypothetical protein
VVTEVSNGVRDACRIIPDVGVNLAQSDDEITRLVSLGGSKTLQWSMANVSNSSSIIVTNAACMEIYEVLVNKCVSKGASVGIVWVYEGIFKMSMTGY